MKLVTIHPDLLDKYSCDSEILLKSKRPYVLVIRLTYKGQSHDFAVPVRPISPHPLLSNNIFLCRQEQLPGHTTITASIT